jgi:hypothetical protein
MTWQFVLQYSHIDWIWLVTFDLQVPGYLHLSPGLESFLLQFFLVYLFICFCGTRGYLFCGTGGLFILWHWGLFIYLLCSIGVIFTALGGYLFFQHWGLFIYFCGTGGCLLI